MLLAKLIDFSSNSGVEFHNVKFNKLTGFLFSISLNHSINVEALGHWL